MYEIIVLTVLWIAAATLFVLSTRRRARQADEELPTGTRLGEESPSPMAEGQEPGLDVSDRIAVRKTALRHVADPERHIADDHRAAQARIGALISQIQYYPNDLSLRRQLIQEYRDHGSKQAAIDQFMLLADRLAEQGDPEGANECMRQVLDIEPWNEHAQRRLGLRGSESTAGPGG